MSWQMKVVGQNLTISHYKNMKKTKATILMFAAACIGVQANPVTITNPSFETPTISSDGSFVTASGASGTDFNGWGWVKTTGSSFQDYGIENPSSGEYTGASGSGTPLGADGINVCFLNQGISSGVCDIFQDIGILMPNTTYTLTVVHSELMQLEIETVNVE